MASVASSTSVPVPSAQDNSPGPIYVDTQHEDLVHDSQLDYYGCKLATSSSGTYVNVLLSCLHPIRVSSFLTLYSLRRSHCQNLQCL